MRDAIACIDRNAKGIVLIVDEERRLIGTVTDGDVRRAILAGVNLEESVIQLRARGTTKTLPASVTALVGTDSAELLRLMEQTGVRQIPLLDQQRRVMGLVTLADLLPGHALPLKAVVMAGGLGQRLRPLTNDVPKVLLRVGDRPILELILEQLRIAGIHHVHLTTHYKAHLIAQHFGDGARFGVNLRYVREDQPLGTAGSLAFVDKSDEPLLVINGDILTRVDFRAFLDFHHEHHADMTMAVRPHEFQIPYGVIETDGVMITGIVEKPTIQHFINAGIYLISPRALTLIPAGQPCDIPDLVKRLMAEGHRVIGFPIREYWMDIGQLADFEQVQTDMMNGTF